MDIAHLRLQQQQIAASGFNSAKKLVAYMGAMQAQDHAMAKWAIGLRLPKATQKDIDAAIDKGEILRTHVLRPTWHFISADDIYWMLELSKANIGAALRSRQKELELTEKLISKTNTIITRLLDGGKHATREDLVAALHKAKIPTDNNRASHIIMHAELEGLVCSGRLSGTKHTYALLPERVKKNKKISHEEALAKLAQKYFFSHGPATLADFTWWSGLPAKEARLALELVKEKLISEKIGEDTYWLRSDLHEPKAKPSVYLLPAFDEYLISYKNRSASILPEHQKKAFSANGIFWPTIVVNGKVSGLWKRSIHKDKVTIETDYFHTHTKVMLKLLERSAEHFGDFLEKELLLGHV